MRARKHKRTATPYGVAVFAPYRRPWHHVNTPYAEEFWDTARRTPFYFDVRDSYFCYSESDKATEATYIEQMLARAETLAGARGGFYEVLGENYLIENAKI